MKPRPFGTASARKLFLYGLRRIAAEFDATLQVDMVGNWAGYRVTLICGSDVLRLAVSARTTYVRGYWNNGGMTAGTKQMFLERLRPELVVLSRRAR